jgi:cytochrome c553
VRAKTKISMCTGCHGIPGYKTAYPVVYHVPKIAGQQPAYIINALKAYKSGERHPSCADRRDALRQDSRSRRVLRHCREMRRHENDLPPEDAIVAPAATAKGSRSKSTSRMRHLSRRGRQQAAA